MGRKSLKQRAIELLKQLNTSELSEVLDQFDVGSSNNSYDNVELLLHKNCPICNSQNHIKKGKTKLGLTIFKCKNCGHRWSN